MLRRKGQQAAVSAPAPSWKSDMGVIDGLGRGVGAAWLNNTWYAFTDVYGCQMWSATDSCWRPKCRGTGWSVSGGFSFDLRKGGAIGGNSTLLFSLHGSYGNAAGGIYRHPYTNGDATLITETYFGAADGGTLPRETGTLIIANDAGQALISCRKRSSSYNGSSNQKVPGGLLLWKTGDTLTEVDGFTEATHRCWMELDWSSKANIAYGVANDNGMDGSGQPNNDHTGTRGGVFVIRSLNTSPTVTRIDNAGTGAPTFSSCNGCVHATLGGIDYLYVTTGNTDTTNTSVWECTVGDPSSGGWTAASVSWRRIDDGSIMAPAACWHNIAAFNDGTKIHLVAGSDTNQGTATGGSYTLSAGAGGSTKNFYCVLAVCNDARAVTPVWASLATSTSWANAGSSLNLDGESRPFIGISLGIVSAEQSRPGGVQWVTGCLAVNADGTQLLAAGKHGVWLCTSPFGATPSWKPYMKGMGAAGTRRVKMFSTTKGMVGDSDHTAWVFNNHDFNGQPDASLDAGGGYGFAGAGTTGYGGFSWYATCFLGTGPITAIVGIDNGEIWRNTDVTNGSAPVAWTKDTYGVTYTPHAVFEYTNAGHTYRLVAGNNGTTQIISKSTDGAAYVQKYTDANGASDIQADFLRDTVSGNILVMLPRTGVMKSTDDGETWTNVWNFSVLSSRYLGRMWQDGVTPTTVWLTKGDGVWQWVNGFTTSAPGARCSETGCPDLTVSTTAGCVDPVNNEIVVTAMRDATTMYARVWRRTTGGVWTEITTPEVQRSIIAPTGVSAYYPNILIGADGLGAHMMYYA
jgi:hypothetical protein